MPFSAKMSKQEFELLMTELADPACPLKRREDFFRWIVRRVGSNTGIRQVLGPLLLSYKGEGIDLATLMPIFAPTFAVICQNEIEAAVAESGISKNR